MLGLGLVKQLLDRENAIVFAGARNPSAADDLQALAQKYSDKLHILKLISSDKYTNEAAAAEVNNITGKLDIVIANAGTNATLLCAMTSLSNTGYVLQVSVNTSALFWKRLLSR